MASVPNDRLLGGLAATLLLIAGGSLFVRREEPALAPVSSGPAEQMPRLARWLAIPLLALLAGVGLAKTAVIADQLVIEALAFKFFYWAGMLSGVALGSWTVATGTSPGLRWRPAGWWLGVAGCGGILLFPLGIRMELWSSAHVSTLLWIFSFKGGVLFLLALPWGGAIGRLLQVRATAWTILFVAGGYVLAQVVSLPIAIVLPFIGTVGIVAGLAEMASRWRTAPRSGRLPIRAGFVAVCLLLVGTTWIARSWFDPTRSALVLFSGEAFIATANGSDLDTIVNADRGRCLAMVEADGAIWTHWRTRGNQLTVRRNGVPISQSTLDAEIGPQNFWSTMTAIVPALLHPRAERVLVLGPTSPVELTTILELPIQSLTSIEPHPALRELIEQQATAMGIQHRLDDTRLQRVAGDPARYLSAPSEETFDVIICPEAVSMSLSAQSHLTRDYYQRAAAHLSDDGILCQRMNIVDYGSSPVKELCRTLREVFEQVTIMTTDGSEVLLLASQSSAPLLDPMLISRLDTPQVRRLCGSLGGDWTMITQLACLPADKVDELLAETSANNTALNARFTTRLARETLCWGDKYAEKRELFANGVDLVLNQMGLADEETQPLIRRIQDSQERTTMFTAIPDNAWEYRKSLKTALKDHPRASLRTVNHELKRTLDPDDQRRKEYLVVLGKVASKPVLAPEEISALLEFSAPFDPLLTDFVHFEVAHLLSRATPRDPVSEYRHWMHCVLTAPDRDRSIRTVGSAMQLIAQHPDVVASPDLRWDHCSLLLEVMRMRWILRWQPGVPPSKFEPSDRQFSLEAIQALLKTMDEIREEAGIASESWKAQRRVWEDTLESPLRTRQIHGNSSEQMKAIVQQEWLKKQIEEQARQK